MLLFPKDTSSEGGAVALELSNLGGVYLVLIVGSCFGVLVALLEMVLGVKERSDENKVDRPKKAENRYLKFFYKYAPKLSSPQTAFTYTT